MRISIFKEAIPDNPDGYRDAIPSGLGIVGVSSLNRRASPCAVDFALSGLIDY